MSPKRKGGRPRLPVAVKAQRGTLRPGRERARGADMRTHPDASVADSPRDYVGIADAYSAGVLSGRTVACGWLVKACRRYLAMRRQAQSEASPYVWSDAHATAICAFAERCPHVEGSWGSATITLEPWQVWLLAACYGFRRREDGGRLVRTVFFQVARKSAKSTLVAICGLFHLAAEQEPGGQVICGATTGMQARIVFAIMQRMVRRSRWLREQGLQAWANAVTHDASGGTAKPINSKSSSQDGLNPSFICLDESHAQTFALHDVLRSAQGARRDPVFMAPTTAGYTLTSVGYALRATAQKILDGVIDSDHTFVALYELDEADDWRDESAWRKAAPMIGITPSFDYVRKYRDDAIATPSMQGEFETKIGNRWLHSASTWLAMADWDACADPTLRREDFAGELACIGGDLAQKDDLAAVAIAFERDGIVYVFVQFYLPRQVVEQRARAVPMYRLWVERGLLTTTDGNVLDEAMVEADVRRWCDEHDVRAIAFDQFGSAGIMTRLASDGLPAVLVPKNAKTFGEPSLDLEVRVRQGLVRHDGNEILRWNASNACVSRRVDGSILPKKDHPDSPNKIDGLDAVLLAMGALSRSIVTDVASRSIYETEELFVI